MAIFLGIDYGLERTGLAISDPGGSMAFPLATLTLKKAGSRGAMLDAIKSHVIASGIENLVLGLPLLADGQESLMSRQVRNIAHRLKRRIDLPLFFMPEILSSFEALEDLRAAGVKSGKIRGILDQQAACRILASFLSQPRNLWMQA